MERPRLRLAEPVRELLDRGPTSPAALLGEHHPLVRTLDALGALLRQALVTSAVLALGALGLLRHAPRAVPIVCAASVVQFGICAAIVLLVGLRRERARELIIDGREALPLPSVAAERRRLLDPRARRKLAGALERALWAAEHYEQLLIASRPPPGVLPLRALAPELREVVGRLRAEEVAVRGVARAARLLTGGYASPLYQGRAEELRLELDRIRRGLLP